MLEVAVPVCLRRQVPVQVDGKSVPAYKALYIATVQDSSDTLDQVRRALPASQGLSHWSWELSDRAELAVSYASADVMN